MDRPWSRRFLSDVATQYRLTAKQRSVFILRHKDGLDYVEIERIHNIKPSTAQKHMSGVYEKFKIEGKSKGKEVELDCLLLDLYSQHKRRHSQSEDAVGRSFGSIDESIFAELLRLRNYSQNNSGSSEVERIWNYSLPVNSNIRAVVSALRDKEISSKEILKDFELLVGETVKAQHSTEEELLLFLLERVLDYTKASNPSQNIYEPLD